MTRFVCFGEILLRLTAPGRELLLQTPRLDAHFGGAEANVAASLARFGHDARMASVLPENAIGFAARDALRAHGVDTSDIRFTPGRIGLYFLTPGAGQRPADVLYDRAGSVFAAATADAIDWTHALEGAGWLHVSGVTPAVSRAAGVAALAAMKAARARGVMVSFDANFRAKLWEARGDDPRPILDALFAEADLVFAEARDIGLVSEQRCSDSAQAGEVAFARYPNLQRIAATERKVISADHHELTGVMHTRIAATRTKTHTVTGIIDRIGGGDAFAAGVLHGVATGAGDRDMLNFAIGAACLKHFIPGDVNLSSEADVRFYLAETGSDVRR